MAQVLKRAAAKRDLTRHFVYLAEHASLEVARRFLDAARGTFIELSNTPEMGSPGKVRQGKFADVRLWRIGGFERYLVAYCPLNEGVVIERVSRCTGLPACSEVTAGPETHTGAAAMTKVNDLHQKWMKGKDYRKAYEALTPEFELARAVIGARVTAGFTQEQLANRRVGDGQRPPLLPSQ